MTNSAFEFLGRKLTRSKTDSVFFGVLGGIAQAYGIDSTLLRLLVVISTLIFPVTPVVYIVALVLMWNT